jgi:site-specific recombinase XerD
MAKITLKNAQTIEDAFEDFIFYKNTQGVTEKTIIYYRTTFQSISKHLDTTINISDLTKKDLQKMIAEMRNSNLATNSIACYVRALRVFLSWAKAEGLCMEMSRKVQSLNPQN